MVSKLTHVDHYQDRVTYLVRTIKLDSDFEMLTVGSVSSMEKVTVLRIIFINLLFFDFIFIAGHLSVASDVYEFTFDPNKVKEVTSDVLLGLDHLRNFKINSLTPLKISENAFVSIPILTSLDLGSNQIWSLPQKLLCDLQSLVTLNLTRNQFGDIDLLGLPLPLPPVRKASILRSQTPVTSWFVQPCLAKLKFFDVSYNNLRRLGSRRFEKMKRLEDLRFEYNWLEELEEDSLFGVESLKSLNLSSNQLTALPATLFHNTRSLHSIDLKNNSLLALPVGVLAGLESLEILDLSWNSLSSHGIPMDTFQSLVRLVILNLSNNQLTHLNPTTFTDLYTLQVLDISNNLISSIPDSAFVSMSNLHSLNLSHNKLISISSQMFNGLYVLHKLALDFNQLSDIEVNVLKNCTSLSDLGLAGNALTSVPETLRGLKSLKTLDLGENLIEKLTNESFYGMSHLYGIRLVANKLEEIPRGICNPTGDLRVFNVAQNKIKKVSSTAFVSCPELRVLRLDSNLLENFPTDLGLQLKNVLWLNISQNQIRHLDYSALPTLLEWLDVSHNQLETLSGAWNIGRAATIGNRAHLRAAENHHNAKLRVVDASHNCLAQINVFSVPPFLDRFLLSYNRLSKIFPDTFSRSRHLRKVDLIGNHLESLPLSAIRYQKVSSLHPLPQFFLGGNPFMCNCDMEYLLSTTQLSATRQYPVVTDIDAIVCRLRYSRSTTFLPLPEMKPQNFLCPYTFHCFQTCECCDFDACDCSMSCPMNCTCFHGDSWTANVVNCANINLTSIPSQIPMDSTTVYLDGNWIPVVKSHSFIGRKTLHSLFLNSSQIQTISNKSLNGLHSLQYLHLQSNRLQHLHGYEFDQLPKVKELYLQDNLIETISNTTFLALKELEVLRLDGNLLSIFTVWQLSLNPYLVQISLSRNPWKCDCAFVHEMSSWIMDNVNKVVESGDIKCIFKTSRNPGPYLIDYKSSCGSSWQMIHGYTDRFEIHTILLIVMGLITVVTMIATVVIVTIVCRRRLRVFLYPKFGLRLCSQAEDEYDHEKSFDAYVLYSHQDEEFVASKIAHELETVENYRLCLHYRDLASESYIDLKEVMTNSMKNSRSLVIFVTKNYLESEWASVQYREGVEGLVAKMEKGLKSVIVILTDLDTTELPQDLCKVSKPLNFSETKFSYKFKFALPPVFGDNSNITSQTTTSSVASSESRVGVKWLEYKNSDWTHHASPLRYHSNHGIPRGNEIPYLFQSHVKSPVPIANLGKKNSSSSTGGESYFSLEGEQVYSTLDPPSPLREIHVATGITYTPSTTQLQQWQHFSSKHAPNGGRRINNVRSQHVPPSDGTTCAQTYLV